MPINPSKQTWQKPVPAKQQGRGVSLCRMMGDNPFGYKFSWSPRGVLLATQNSAQFLLNDQIQNITSADLLKSAKEVKDLHPVMIFEGIPNRDSLKYIKLYGLKEDHLKTMFRGTLRYKVIYRIIHYFNFDFRGSVI